MLPNTATHLRNSYAVSALQRSGPTWIGKLIFAVVCDCCRKWRKSRSLGTGPGEANLGDDRRAPSAGSASCARFFLVACAVIFLGVVATGIMPSAMNG